MIYECDRSKKLRPSPAFGGLARGSWSLILTFWMSDQKIFTTISQGFIVRSVHPS